MLIGAEVLLKLVKENKLVENLSERELTNPEGAGFDIRVGEVFKLKSGSYLGITERQTSEIETVAKIGEDKSYTLKPGEYILVKTMESFNVPSDLAMITYPRSTLQRGGVLLLCTQTAPGYKGELTFGLKNLGEHDYTFELGARLFHVMFHEVEGKAVREYEGQWKGGRVSTGGKETQN